MTTRTRLAAGALTLLTLTACNGGGNATPTTTSATPTTTATTAVATTTTTIERTSSPTLPPPTSSTTSPGPTVPVPPGAPPLDLYNTDLAAVTRAALEFKVWSDKNPVEGLASLGLWLSPGGPYEERLRPQFEKLAAAGTKATGGPEILDMRVESNDGAVGTVLVWSRSDPYEAVSADGTKTSIPGYERTLSVVDLTRQPDGRWTVYDLRVPQTG